MIKVTTTLLAISLAAASTAHAENRLSWSDADSDAVAAKVEEGAFGTVTSILILDRGAPVFERYFNDADAATLHDTRSATKTITGMAVGRAVADGLIAADARVAGFFADIAPFDNPDPRKLDVTVEDLLTMSGPLECDDWNRHSRGNEERMYIIEDWPSFFWDLPIRGFPSWVAKPEDSPYGRTFSYCSAGVQMLGEVVERASGMAATDYFESKLFAPLGVTDFEWRRNGVGQAHMLGGLLLSTRALGQFAELQRNGGVAGGRQILPATWTEASIEPRAVIPGDEWEYGYLWWLATYEVDGVSYRAAAMNGNGGNRVLVLPEFGVSIVFTKTDYNRRGMHDGPTMFFEEEIVPRLVAD